MATSEVNRTLQLVRIFHGGELLRHPCPLFLDETGLILDETGLNLALAHLWGRSFRGSRAYSQRLFQRVYAQEKSFAIAC